MYNKLFTKILDSSVWLAPDPHRLVWITLIAAMDQDSLAAFACAENLACRARVSIADTERAIAAFEAPDPRDPTQEYEGRRIERVPGGWLILNGQKYRSLVTRAVAGEQSRLRMQRYREKLRNVTQPLQSVTPSYAVSEHMHSKAKTLKPVRRKRCPDTFEITASMSEWATINAPDVDPVAELAKFRDWEFRTARVDWPACWRTWMRTAQERAKPKARLNGEAADVWRRLIESAGADPSPRTVAIEAAIKACGGWSAIRLRTPFDEPKLRKSFEEAYYAAV